MEMLREYVDITGTDLSQLRQSWESSTAEECWLNDNVEFMYKILNIYSNSIPIQAAFQGTNELNTKRILEK